MASSPITFRVRNARSFRREAELSMLATASYDPKIVRTLELPGQ